MAIISLIEIVHIVAMSLAVGFIFNGYFKPAAIQDPIAQWKKASKSTFWYTVALVAPAIILHEFGHKFVAMAFGLQATFQAAYTWLGVGIVLKLVSAPFLFFVPAYVSIVGQATPGMLALTAFAGPAVNGLLFLISWVVLLRLKNPQWIRFWQYTKMINGFLFVFNMLPIPLFDGFQVYENLARMVGFL